MDPAIQLLRTLVAINSVNPSLVDGAPGEAEIASAIAEHLRRIGLDVHVQEAAPGRPNVIGVLDSRRAGPSLLFCGHVDTVGVEGMAAPFAPIERDGRIYGRGAQDMKGGVAAMIDAARVLAARPLPRGRVVVAAVVDEEYASIGADALVREWTADAAVVTEPTDLQIGVGHKGFAWFEIETIGRAAHGSRPAEGIDAILHMGHVLRGLDELNRQLMARVAHPIMGTPSLHASIIDGGRELSVYPDRCRLQLERRTVTGETDAGITSEIAAVLECVGRDVPAFTASSRLTFARPPYALAPDHALPAALEAALSAGGRQVSRTGMSFWTDAAVLGAAGIPAVLFGPGGAGLHSVEEYVRVDEVVACRDALVRLAEEWIRAG